MSTWPDVKASKFAQPDLPEKRHDRRKSKQAALTKEISERRARWSLTATDEAVVRRSAENFQLLEQIHDRLRSAEFRAWYEATTGDPVDPWLEEVLLSPADFIISRHFELSRDQLAWTEQRIRSVADNNRWRNPELVGMWAAEIAACEDPPRRRQMLIRLGTPRWANREKMLAIYLERARLEEETGIPHEVDHIVPVVNKLVCGLHWEGNMRIITTEENRRKSNRFDPNTFSG